MPDRIIRYETIYCPNCGSENVNVPIVWREGDPWPSFVHDCDVCKYTISESEWNEKGLEKGDEN